MNVTLKVIEEALCDVLEEPVENLTVDTDLLAEYDLDSIMFVQFLLTLEDKLPGLIFDPETLTQSSFYRVQDLIQYIELNNVSAQQ